MEIVKGHTYKMHDGKPGTVFRLPGEPYGDDDDEKPGRSSYKETYSVSNWGSFSGCVSEISFAHPIEEVC